MRSRPPSVSVARRRVAVGCLLAALPAAAPGAFDVDPAVLDAQARRVDAIATASATAVAIFAGAAGGGSGVLVTPDGYALTNFHVVEPAGVAMRCGLADGRLYDAILVGLDPTGDVAVVKLLGRDDFPHATLADSDLVEPGDFCFAAGNPFLLATDFAPSISAGIVSGTHRYQFPAGTILEYADCLQVDAAINPGNSGGGLFDAAAGLIGVNGRASFEKRGRVNVGVGYAISSNQLRNFLGILKGGRVADHATLGATVASSADGRVVVSDILETSDAYRRGLRYDDEVVALAGRPVRTVNAFKNVLGTLPAGWQVPLVIRRDGQPQEILVRLAAVHTTAELAAIVSGESRRPPQPEGEKPAEKQAEPELPEAVRGLYESRPGFANHHFNVLERDRVARAIAARSAPAAEEGTWTLSGTLATGQDFAIELSATHGLIDLPTGTSRIDATADLDTDPQPPGSGGLLAALLLWRRLILEGPVALGRTTYWGTAPVWVPAGDGSPVTAAGPLVDILETAVAGVEARFAVADDGRVVGIDLWTAPDADPCEVRILEPLPGDDRGLPGVFEVRRGGEPFGVFRVTKAERTGAAP